MKRLSIATVAAVLAAPALADGTPPRPAAAPRAAGPPLSFAVPAAEAAVAACAARGYHVTALVTDAAGEPVVLLSGDGASLLSQRFARIKIATVMRYRVASGEVAARAQSDTRLAAEIKADPDIGLALPGAVPLMREGRMIGAFAVSGAAGGEMDQSCLDAALARVPLR